MAHKGKVIEHPEFQPGYQAEFICSCNWHSLQPSVDLATQIGQSHLSNWGADITDIELPAKPEPAPTEQPKAAAPAVVAGAAPTAPIPAAPAVGAKVG